MILPGGSAVRAQLGDSYFLLPVPHEIVRHCEWCRRKMTADQIDEIETKHWEAYVARSAIARPLPAASRPPQSVLPCELREFWPSGVRIRATEGAGLPQPTLPDGRWVVCIPTGKSFGNILPREWEKILKAARLARGPLINHAYERTLENLQEWQRIGRDVMARYAARSDWLARRGHLGEGEDPFPDFNAQVPLMTWVQDWTPDLYQEGFRNFRPFERARLVLSSATGFEPRTIESIVQRERTKAVRPKHAETGAPTRRPPAKRRRRG